MHVCSPFYADSSSSSQGILLQNQNQKLRRLPKSVDFVLRLMSAQNLMASKGCNISAIVRPPSMTNNCPTQTEEEHNVSEMVTGLIIKLYLNEYNQYCMAVRLQIQLGQILQK